ncbi:MAG TPA: squalene/phytoene synthase family protein [Rhodospirillaceae bacterium]|nr:squalene/phytoene synthase family protein [Rhodospirillaceae bacterium]
MASPETLSESARAVRQQDRDRFATALFAPADRREALFVLYAFNLEIARARELVREPMLGRIRLQWWRDSLDKVYAGADAGAPLADALAKVITRHDLPRAEFEALLEAREADMESDPPADLAALEAYAEGTSATLTRLAARVLGGDGEAVMAAARHVGIAWALTGLLRAVPFHAAQGRLYLPGALLDRHGVGADQVLAGKGGEGLAAVGGAIAEAARGHLAAARRSRRGISKSVIPALLTAPLADAYLRGLDRAGGNLFDGNWSTPRPRPLALVWAMTTGRF